MRTVPPAAPTAGPQAETLPAASVVRNWTSVSPSELGDTEPPAPVALHEAPPSEEVRYS
jgi:hypothetical protein